MVDVLGVDRNYASLSTTDLLEARDLYHWHLINKQQRDRHRDRAVLHPEDRRLAVGAAGRGDDAAPGDPKPARTFENSEVRDYSWPCILVLVDTWVRGRPVRHQRRRRAAAGGHGAAAPCTCRTGGPSRSASSRSTRPSRTRTCCPAWSGRKPLSAAGSR